MRGLIRSAATATSGVAGEVAMAVFAGYLLLILMTQPRELNPRWIEGHTDAIETHLTAQERALDLIYSALATGPANQQSLPASATATAPGAVSPDETQLAQFPEGLFVSVPPFPPTGDSTVAPAEPTWRDQRAVWLIGSLLLGLAVLRILQATRNRRATTSANDEVSSVEPPEAGPLARDSAVVAPSQETSIAALAFRCHALLAAGDLAESVKSVGRVGDTHVEVQVEALDATPAVARLAIGLEGAQSAANNSLVFAGPDNGENIVVTVSAHPGEGNAADELVLT
jgi:hypothetical protein